MSTDTLQPTSEAEKLVASLTQSSEARAAEPIPEVENIEADEHSLLGLVELLLKSSSRVDRLVRDPAKQPELITHFLAIGLTCLAVFSGCMVMILAFSPAQAVPNELPAAWSPFSAVGMSLAYTLGFVAAAGVCLPSFYFYGLLAGVRITMLEVTAHLMKGMAATGVMLIGLLPIYVAIVMGMIVFQATAESLEAVLWLGLLLPFQAGLWGVWSTYRGFLLLSDTLPEERRYRRTCFLRRLTVSWSVCYTAVAPVMIYTLWGFFAALLTGSNA